MDIADFRLERFFARWEFAAPHNLCASDVLGVPMGELLALADDDARERWDALSLGYTEAPGLPELRREIAGLYEGLGPEHVHTFSGAEEAIFVLMHALLAPGDHVVAVWPSYQALYEVARAIGAEVTLLELRQEDGWRLDLDAYREALRPTTKLVILNEPHSPTGALLGREDFDRMSRLAAEVGARFFVDEVYRFLEYEERDRLPAGAEVGEHGISLGVMSKAFGLAGLRIGWLASPDTDLLARCARIKDYTTICNSAPSEVLALIGLRARDRLLERALGIVRPNRALFEAFFAEHADAFDWVPPSAGSVGFPRLRLDVPVDRFVDDLVVAEGVLLLPGTVFEHPGNHVRVGLGRPGIGEGLERLARFLAGFGG